MAEVTPFRDNIEVEEVRAEAAASEGTMTKIAGSVNFWNTFFTGPRQMAANGPYSNGIAPDTLVDGPVVAESRCEVYALTVWNFNAGTSGTTEFDIVCHPPDGSPSFSIFTTTPKIPNTADHVPFAIIAQTFTPTATVLRQSTGTTAAVLIGANDFPAGSTFTLTLVTKQANAQNCGVQLSLRPIN